MTVTGKVRRFSGGVYEFGSHVVWCPKRRPPVLGSRVAERLDELIRQGAEERDWQIITLEVTPDHVRCCQCLVRSDGRNVGTARSSQMLNVITGACHVETMQKSCGRKTPRPDRYVPTRQAAFSLRCSKGAS
ncbi:transposase [Streptomyces sp. NPDC006879]|uniref:transposase n=1 Tax=Streptomyces sp. NPDC006879 TaxID=3364767 RepID=UPI003681C09E